MSLRKFIVRSVLLLSVVISTGVDAALFETEAKYFSDATNAVLNGQYGFVVAVDGPWLVVGAPDETVKSSNTANPAKLKAGAVHVYQRNADGSYSEYQRIFLPYDTANEEDKFGIGVAIKNDVVVVGAEGIDGGLANTGAAFVYEFDHADCTAECWIMTQTLASNASQSQEFFGNTLSFDGETIAVGAKAKEAVYVFEYNGTSWAQTKKLGPTAAGGTIFGRSIAVNGDFLAIGAHGEGAVYIFNRTSGWAEEEKIAGQSSNESFGFDVDLDGITLVVGVRDATVAGNLYSGSVRLFERNNGANPKWAGGSVTTLEPLQSDNITPDTAPFRFFGSAVDISQDGAGLEFIVVGAPTSSPGYAYLYQKNAGVWTQIRKLVASDGVNGDGYGSSVAVDGAAVVSGAPNRDEYAESSGAVYTYYDTTDTDGDGLADQVEAAICRETSFTICTQIGVADSDGDGLDDAEELAFGGGPSGGYDIGDLNPVNPDTDGDTFSDGDEVLAGSDPLDPSDIPTSSRSGDVNGDGFVNVVDVLLATQIALGLKTPANDEILRGNVAPLEAGVPNPADLVVGLDDVLLIQRKALGLVDF